MNFHTTLAVVSLVAALAALLYSLNTARQTKRIWTELERQRQMGMDAWLADQVRRWSAGELPSRTEKGSGLAGTDVEVIEPLPGWSIVVGTTAFGKRVPFETPSVSWRGK